MHKIQDILLGNRFRNQIRREHGDAGAWTAALVFLALIVTIFFVLAYYVFGVTVSPGYMGVRQTTLGPTQGFSERGLAPGLHFTIPFITKIHEVPESIQVLEFHATEPGEQSGGAITGNGLELRTSDGVSVNVDVSVLVRFFEAPDREGQDAHGGPADLFTKVGITEADWDNQVRRTAADELRRSLGALLARKFYEAPDERQEAIERGKEAMRKRLNPFGIEVLSVLLRRYTFSDSLIDDAIFDKNLQEQEAHLKDAEGKFADVKSQLERVAAEWDAKVQTLRVKGENNAQVIRSEATLLENEKKAEGDLLVAKAVAEVDRLRAGALAQSAGAQVYVARELAPLLASLKGGVVSNLDPYDLEAWAKKLGVSGAQSGGLSSIISAEPSNSHEQDSHSDRGLARTYISRPTASQEGGAR